MGAYAQVSERLIERGYAASPIMPGSKAPGYLRAGKWVGLRGWQTRFDNGRIPSPYQRQLWGAGDTAHKRPWMLSQLGLVSAHLGYQCGLKSAHASPTSPPARSLSSRSKQLSAVAMPSAGNPLSQM
jgi:hypothetical protein